MVRVGVCGHLNFLTEHFGRSGLARTCSYTFLNVKSGGRKTFPDECNRFSDCFKGSQHSSVGMARGWTADESGFDSRNGQEIFFSSVRTSTGAHPAYYPTVTGGSYTEAKLPRRDTTQLYLLVRLLISGVLPPLQSRMFH